MSGYGGQPPGWSDPYGSQDPYGSYGQQQPGYGYGPPGVPYASSGSGDKGGLIAALVISSVFTLFCCNVLAVPAIVLSAVGLGKADTDPAAAHNLTKWSWVTLGIGAIVYIAGIGLWFFLAVRYGETSTGPTTY